MKKKLLAIGNVLMGDDAIAIYLASELQEELRARGIEVIYGETDIGYCISCIEESDYIIIMDAADFGKAPGEVNLLSIGDSLISSKAALGHSISFLDMITLYLPMVQGVIITIQIADLNFRYGLSEALQNRFTYCTSEVMKYITKIH